MHRSTLGNRKRFHIAWTGCNITLDFAAYASV